MNTYNQHHINWCIEQHKNTNHMYDEYLPYEFHLRMTANVAEQFMYLTANEAVTPATLYKAAWGHDLIEDTRVSYHQVCAELGLDAADIIYAVTNEKGRNRAERANSTYYEGIRSTPGAVFIKLCDRIANIQYSKMTKSGMFEKYKSETDHFLKELSYTGSPLHPYYEMIVYLTNLFD